MHRGADASWNRRSRSSCGRFSRSACTKARAKGWAGSGPAISAAGTTPNEALGFTIPQSLLLRARMTLFSDCLRLGAPHKQKSVSEPCKPRQRHWLKNPGLSEEGSRYIIQMNFNAVGFDAPSPDQPPFMAHKLLLPEGIVIYENLANLDKVLGKHFLFVGTPLALVGGTASPCRPVALVM